MMCNGVLYRTVCLSAVCCVLYCVLYCVLCRAFSVVETIESRAAILNFSLSELSTQEVLSCDPNQNGCGGGVPQLAFHWLSNVSTTG